MYNQWPIQKQIPHSLLHQIHYFSGSDDSFGRQEETTESSFRRRGYTYHGLRHGGGGMHVGSYQYGNFIELGIVLGMFLKILGKVSLQNYPGKGQGKGKESF